MKKSQHNGIISLWKFIFACVIVLFHCNTFYAPNPNFFVKGGYIAVEFFFIVSGFYMAKKAFKKETKNIGKETIEYIWNFLKKLLPYILISFITIYTIKIIYESHKTYEWVNSLWNVLLLRQAGFNSMLINNQFWFLTSMIIGMLILYPLLKKYKYNFIYIASPLIVIMGLGYLNHQFGYKGLDHAYHIWDEIWYTGTIRAIIELNIGFIIYLINKKCKNIEYTNFGKALLTIGSHSLLLLVIFIIQFLDNSKNYDYIMLLFISIAIAIAVSDKTYDRKLLSNKFIFFLEKISMPMFINHIGLIEVVKYVPIFSGTSQEFKAIASLITTIIFSTIEYIIISKISKIDLSKRVKKLLIKEKTTKLSKCNIN